MSWGETLKALNKDPNKSLDVLIKEQFENNFGSSGDVSYIKNTQLGTNLNNLLNGSSSSSIDFNNKPLVDKVNYLLLCSNAIEYTPTLQTKQTLLNYEKKSKSGNKINIGYFRPKKDGSISLEGNLKIYNRSTTSNSGLQLATAGIFIRKNQIETKVLSISNTECDNKYYTKVANISVKKGDEIEFILSWDENYWETYIYCNKFSIGYSFSFMSPV